MCRQFKAAAIYEMCCSSYRVHKTEDVVTVMRNADSSSLIPSSIGHDAGVNNAIQTLDLAALLRKDRFPNTPQPLILQ
jgi:hypothetical protein